MTNVMRARITCVDEDSGGVSHDPAHQGPPPRSDSGRKAGLNDGNLQLWEVGRDRDAGVISSYSPWSRKGRAKRRFSGI